MIKKVTIKIKQKVIMEKMTIHKRKKKKKKKIPSHQSHASVAGSVP